MELVAMATADRFGTHLVARIHAADSSFDESRLDDVARITADQTAELARFVAQCSPDTLQQILSMLA